MEEWPGFSQVPDEDLIPIARPEGQALSKHVWWNGTVQPAADKSIHYYAHALHYGTAAFEGIRCYPTPQGPALLRLRDHMERLHNSAALYGMRLGYSIDQLCDGALEVARRNLVTNAYLRPLAFFGYGPIDLTPKNLFDRLRHHQQPVFVAFGVTDLNCVTAEIQVLYAQP